MFQLFRSRAEIYDEQRTKKLQPFIAQNIAKLNFKSKYLSETFDGVQSTPNLNAHLEFKDISDVKKNN